MPPFAFITNIQSFSAAHRLHNPTLSNRENWETYGKCNHINSHGHNYKVEACVFGPVDPVTGCVMNLRDLKKLLLQVIDPLDHKRLDVDIDFFHDHVATAENISIYIWQQLEKILPPHVRLHVIRLHETDKNFVEYRRTGEES